MRASWWWIDRWRKSSAYSDMTAEQQGLYRNLLDELWLRDGLLPKSPKAIAQISGDYEAWQRNHEIIMARFYECPDGWRNETHEKVMAESKRKAANQAAYRSRNRKPSDNGDGNVTDDVPRSPSPSPSPDQTPSPQPPLTPPSRGGVLDLQRRRARMPRDDKADRNPIIGRAILDEFKRIGLDASDQTDLLDFSKLGDDDLLRACRSAKTAHGLFKEAAPWKA